MDIQRLVDEARQQMLTRGTIMPIVYLDLTKTSLMLVLDILNDKQSIPVQCGMISRQGWERCKAYPDQKPVAIGIYAEAWKSQAKDITQNLRPSRDPKRREIISVSTWHAEQEPHIVSYTLPVVRDSKKRVVEIGPGELQATVPILLDAFLRGVQDAQKLDEDVFSGYEKAIRENLSMLSPKQKEALDNFLRDDPNLQGFMQREGFV